MRKRKREKERSDGGKAIGRKEEKRVGGREGSRGEKKAVKTQNKSLGETKTSLFVCVLCDSCILDSELCQEAEPDGEFRIQGPEPTLKTEL